MKSLVPTTVRKNPWVRTLVLILVFCTVIGFAYWIRDILLPFFLAFIIAYILDPVVDWIEENIGLSRTFSVVVTLFFITLILLGFMYYLTDKTVELANELGRLADNPPDIRVWLNTVIPEMVQEFIRKYADDLDAQLLVERVIAYLRDHVTEIMNALTEGSTYIWFFALKGLGALGFVINVSVILIVAIYLLRDFDVMVSSIRSYIPHQYRSEVDSMFSEIDELMRAFLRGHLIVCVIIGVLYGSGYQFVGLNGGFLVGFLSGLMNVVPYLGPAAGFIAALLMALYQFGLSIWVLAIIAVYVTVQSLEGNLLTPRIVGGAVGLNPVVVIFALMVFGKLLGFLGLLLAIPLACVVKVVLSRLTEQYRQSDYFQPEESSE